MMRLEDGKHLHLQAFEDVRARAATARTHEGICKSAAILTDTRGCPQFVAEGDSDLRLLVIDNLKSCTERRGCV